MNERIKELAIEAGMIIGDISNFDMAAIMPKESKFAELIVQKCADIGEQYADGNYEVRNQILEHFGLEEE
jgi:hypothetical protein